MSMSLVVRLAVNGQVHEVATSPHRTLLEVLREDLGLTGTKHGCEQGECGACTVLLDGKPVLACLTLAVEAQGREILTVEGLGRPGALDPLQEAFMQAGALQCGYCTPGFLLAAKALLAQNPSPTREEILEALSGNLCRCTGYLTIVQAVELVASKPCPEHFGPERASGQAPRRGSEGMRTPVQRGEGSAWASSP